jgi:hypothetical protein
MFHKKQVRPPSGPFSHTDDCPILKADPGVELEWSRTEYGMWRRECRCGSESWQEPARSGRTRVDPRDPKTARHLPQCEFVSVADPVILRALLKVQDKEGYAWVECGSCAAGWQVPDYAEKSVR